MWREAEKPGDEKRVRRRLALLVASQVLALGLFLIGCTEQPRYPPIIADDSADAIETSGRVAALESDLADARSKIEDLELSTSQREGDVQRLEGEVRDLENDVQRLTRQVSDLEARLY